MALAAHRVWLLEHCLPAICALKRAGHLRAVASIIGGQEDQALSKSLLTVRETIKELLGVLELRRRTCLAALKCKHYPARLE
jgi:hypothetical protein